MNAADIAAARRLIAQFEDKADGRHNSTNVPALRPTELPPPQKEGLNDLPVTYRPKPSDFPAGFEWMAFGGLRAVLDIPLPLIANTSIKASWQDCAVGDYAEKINDPFTNFDEWLGQILNNIMVIGNPNDPSDYAPWIFERAVILSPEGNAKNYWKRVK
jgi:hypothetical protein